MQGRRGLVPGRDSLKADNPSAAAYIGPDRPKDWTRFTVTLCRWIPAIALVVGALTPGPAWPCAFHNYTPAPSVVERLLESQVIVLARSDPQDPFRYRVTQILRGGPPLPEIPFLVDTATRKMLAKNAKDQVLFSYDDVAGKWLRLGYIGSTSAPFFDGIFANLDDWAVQDGTARYALFGRFINDPDRRVRRLALNELDQAPYDVLQALDLRPDTELLIRELGLPEEANLRAIRVLLLGFSSDKRAGEVLNQGFQAELSAPLQPLLGAFATSMIERDGVVALDRVRQALDPARNLSPDTETSIIEALAIQDTYGAEETRQAIAVMLRELLHQNPSLAVQVAARFESYGNWSQADLMRELIARRLIKSTTEMLTVARYVAIAREISEASGNSLN